jgi:hypothetical protein
MRKAIFMNIVTSEVDTSQIAHLDDKCFQGSAPFFFVMYMNIPQRLTCNRKVILNIMNVCRLLIRITKARRMRWAGHVARGRRMLIDYWWESQRERAH